MSVTSASATMGQPLKKHFYGELSNNIQRGAEARSPVLGICRKHAISYANFYLWREKFGGMAVSEVNRLCNKQCSYTILLWADAREIT
ncbi:transposase [Enterobacter bugandensis]|uniref:transposase n=1 Tax=Enterobacter bugandensis TaxID=881260 RepID=UPI003BF8E610